MGIKTKARMTLEKLVGRYGYIMCKPENKLGMYSLITHAERVPFDEESFARREEGKYVVNWVVPPLGPGSGGHLDIFRAIRILTDMGITNRVYTCGGNECVPSNVLKQAVKDYYGIDLGNKNEIHANFRDMRHADAVIATSWFTAYVVDKFDNALTKFYFVQDFEPYFFPRGAEYCFAENTYKMGFRGITAGGWLAQKLHDEYGMETQSFSFSYERELYQPKEKKDSVNRVFYYARPYTERRAFEMGILALEKLAEIVPDLEVIFAGQQLVGYDLKFTYQDMGILPLNRLCDVYSQCDMCLVLSMTNLSLLPMEIMASGSVVVSNKGPNNEWLLNDDNAIMVDSEPEEIAEVMAYYLNHKDELSSKRQKGIDYVQKITWQDEIAKVYDFMTASIDADVRNKEEILKNRK